MRIGVFILSILSSASAAADLAPPVPKGASSTIQRLSCSGPFLKTATHASLVKHFGAKNVAWEMVDGPEGSTYGVTAIFPKDPAKRLEVVWRDEEGRKELLSIDVKTEETVWTAPAGVTIKMPIAEVERRNGKPFLLMGFQWDMWGWVVDWKDGKLLKAAKDLGCDGFTVRFEETGDSSKAAGEGPYASNAKGMRRAKPVVTSFGVGFAYPAPAQ
jgi:hypothetical protein